MSMPELEDHTEVEWQFDVEDLARVERWLGDLPASLSIAVTEIEPAEQLDTYFDTSDWRVYRAGYALRSRRAADHIELTLKSIDQSHDGFHRRREMTQLLEGGESDSLDEIVGPIGSRINAIRGRKSTSPLFAVITHRKRYRLWSEGRQVGEISLDNTTFVGHTFDEQSHHLRVEVETSEDYKNLLTPFVEAMSSACKLRPASLSKFQTGAMFVGLNPSVTPSIGSMDIDRSATIFELSLAVLRFNFFELLRHEPGTRLGDDVEELHDMRVAARRLRAALSLFSSYLPEQFGRIRDELRWVATALGEVRDLDVQLAEIQRWKATLDPLDAAALDLLVDELSGRRDVARGRMLEMLDSERYEQLTDDFTELLANLQVGADSDRALVVIPELVVRRYKKLRRSGDKLNGSSANIDFHPVRIQSKKLRYTLEFVSPLYGKTARQFIRRLVDVQDLLGRIQDSVVAIEHLREIAVDPAVSLPAPTVFAIGRVAECYARDAIECRTRFSNVYGRLSGKRFERLERELRRRSRKSKRAEEKRSRRKNSEHETETVSSRREDEMDIEPV